VTSHAVMRSSMCVRPFWSEWLPQDHGEAHQGPGSSAAATGVGYKWQGGARHREGAAAARVGAGRARGSGSRLTRQRPPGPGLAAARPLILQSSTWLSHGYHIRVPNLQRCPNPPQHARPPVCAQLRGSLRTCVAVPCSVGSDTRRLARPESPSSELRRLTVPAAKDTLRSSLGVAALALPPSAAPPSSSKLLHVPRLLAALRHAPGSCPPARQ
jgi:hypothetical protein